MELDAPLATKDWVKTSVLALDTAKINRVSVEITGEPPLKLERPAPRGPEGRQGGRLGGPNEDAPKADAKDAKAPEWRHPPFEPRSWRS